MLVHAMLRASRRSKIASRLSANRLLDDHRLSLFDVAPASCRERCGARDAEHQNLSNQRQRANACFALADATRTAKRVDPGPASVVRLGHVVLAVSDMQRVWDWWQSRFGLIASDEVRAPNDMIASLFLLRSRGGADRPSPLNFASDALAAVHQIEALVDLVRAFGNVQGARRHQSNAISSPMTISVYAPPHKADAGLD